MPHSRRTDRLTFTPHELQRTKRGSRSDIPEFRSPVASRSCLGPRWGHQTHRDGPRHEGQLTGRYASSKRDDLGWSRRAWTLARTSNLRAEVRLLPSRKLRK